MTAPTRPPFTDPSPAPDMRFVIRLGLGVSALLALGAGGAFWYASTTLKSPPADEQVTVTIAARACLPDELIVPEGRTTFRIVNATDHTVEWEILDGVMVLEERENIAPGFAQTLTARLEPGSYEITCGLISSPRGRLIVTPSINPAASGTATRPDLAAFIGALAQYKVILGSTALDLASGADDLAAAVDRGDETAARQALGLARASSEQMSANVTSDAVVSDLNALALELTPDPAARLVRDTAGLSGAIRAARLTPHHLLTGAASLLERLTAPTPGITGPVAPLEASAVSARLAGARDIIALLKPLADKAAPELSTAIGRDSAALTAALATMTSPLAQWPDADRQTIESRARILATDLRRLARQWELN